MPFKFNPFTGELDLVSDADNFIGQIDADSGSATPTGGVINLFGGDGIITSATGDTVTVSMITPVSVSNGGTGRITASAYSVICGGTTSTSAHQSVATLGTTGQVLTSNGASALPTWEDTGDVTAAASLDDFAVVCGDGGAKGVQTVAAVGTSGQVLTSNGAGALPTFQDAGSGALEFVSFQTASGISSVEFTSLPSLTKFFLIFEKLDPVTGGSYLTLEVSNDNGATWITTGYEAGCLHFAFNGTAGTNTNSTTHFPLSGFLNSGGASHGGGEIVLTSMQQPDHVRISGTVSFLDNTTSSERFGTIGGRSGSTGFNALRLRMSSGNINFGRFALYGYKDS